MAAKAFTPEHALLPLTLRKINSPTPHCHLSPSSDPELQFTAKLEATL
jgi:hypothetical protein